MTLLEEVKRPIFVFTTVLSILLALIPSLYFYNLSKENREPYYYAYPTSQIYDKSVVSPKVRLVDINGDQVKENVQVIEVSFWNNGKKTIDPSDVRVPVAMKIQGISKILDYSIAKESNPDISQFRVGKVLSKADELSISWKHLDPGLGVRIQVIYSGPKDAEVKLSGAIVGAEISNAVGRSIPDIIFNFLFVIIGACLAGVPNWINSKLIGFKPIYKIFISWIPVPIIGVIIYSLLRLLLNLNGVKPPV